MLSKENFIKGVSAMSVAVLLALITVATSALAADPLDITTGLNTINGEGLATKILAIASGAAALAGVVAAGVLTYLGFKLKTGGEKDRAETKEHIMWVFIGLGLVGFAAVIAGFAAQLIKTNAGV